MSNYYKGTAVRETTLGIQVVKLAQTFPQGAPGTATLFTVAGGLCLVTSLVGYVSTVLTTDPQLSLGTAPTVGTLETSGIATTKVMTNAEVGTLITVGHSSGLPTTLVVMASAAKAGSVVFENSLGFAVYTGTITQTAQAAAGGAIDWYLTYIPVTTGAAIT